MWQYYFRHTIFIPLVKKAPFSFSYQMHLLFFCFSWGKHIQSRIEFPGENKLNLVQPKIQERERGRKVLPKFAEKAMKVDVVKTGQQLRGADLYYRFCRFSKLINKDKKKRSGKVQQVNQKWKVLSHVKMSKTFSFG